MTQAETRAKILSGAANERLGFPASIYLNEARALAAEGLIEMRERFSATGRVDVRWFLKAA